MLKSLLLRFNNIYGIFQVLLALLFQYNKIKILLVLEEINVISLNCNVYFTVLVKGLIKCNSSYLTFATKI